MLVKQAIREKRRRDKEAKTMSLDTMKQHYIEPARMAKKERK
jgi:hypothetical protein